MFSVQWNVHVQMWHPPTCSPSVGICILTVVTLLYLQTCSAVVCIFSLMFIRRLLMTHYRLSPNIVASNVLSGLCTQIRDTAMPVLLISTVIDLSTSYPNRRARVESFASFNNRSSGFSSLLLLGLKEPCLHPRCFLEAMLDGKPCNSHTHSSSGSNEIYSWTLPVNVPGSNRQVEQEDEPVHGAQHQHRGHALSH